MIIHHYLEQLCRELTTRGAAEVNLAGCICSMRLRDNNSKIHLSSPVFLGEGYVPPNVRSAVGEPLPHVASGVIRTSLYIDETSGSIYLVYLGVFDDCRTRQFAQLLEEFVWLSEIWREYLDDRGKDDLIRIPAS